MVGLLRLAYSLWCMANWYSTRVLLYFDFPAEEQWHPRRTGVWKSIHAWVRAQVPRILGAAPMWVVGASLLNALRTYERTTSAWPWLLGFGILCIVTGFAIWGALIIRRRILDSSETVVQRERHGVANSLDVRYRTLSELEPGTKRALLLIAVLCVVAFVAFSIHPLFLADKIGTGAVLMLAAACWVFAGSALVYWGSWRRLPIITFLVFWVALCSLNNDNHRVRTSPREKLERVPIRKAFADWGTYITHKYANRPVHPLYIVATKAVGFAPHTGRPRCSERFRITIPPLRITSLRSAESQVEALARRSSMLWSLTARKQASCKTRSGNSRGVDFLFAGGGGDALPRLSPTIYPISNSCTLIGVVGWKKHGKRPGVRRRRNKEARLRTGLRNPSSICGKRRAWLMCPLFF